MIAIATGMLLIAGALFSLLGAVGILRMPDLFTRLQASTKAGTLGVGCIMLATALHFGEFGVVLRALIVIVFLLLTAPVAAHVIARAAYGSDTPLWERTGVDDLRTAPERTTGTQPSRRRGERERTEDRQRAERTRQEERVNGTESDGTR